MDDFGEEYFLRDTVALGGLTQILFEEDAEMGAVLVDNHQARLHSREDISPFILIVCGRFVFEMRLGMGRIGWWDELIRRLFGKEAWHMVFSLLFGVELFPSRRCGGVMACGHIFERVVVGIIVDSWCRGG